MHHNNLDSDLDPLLENDQTTLSRMSKAVRGIFTLNNSNQNININSEQSTNNNWTKEMNDTVMVWKSSLSNTSFIYQYAKDVKKKKLTTFSLVSFILTMIATVISGGTSLAISSDSQPYKTIALVFSILVFCINSSASILNGIITKIYKLDIDVESYTKYIENIDELYATISVIHDMPTNLREDAISFIQRESKKYNDLMRKGPDIDNSLYLEANKKYQEFLKIHINTI